MNLLSTFGSVAVYLWVAVTLLIGLGVEVALVWLCFGEWKARRAWSERPHDCCPPRDPKANYNPLDIDE